MKISLLIANRYLFTKKKEATITFITIIAILGVCIGVITLNVVMAVMTGFQIELKNKLLSSDAHILIRHLNGELNTNNNLLKDIYNIKEIEKKIKSITPYTYNQVLIQSNYASSGILLQGLPEQSENTNILKDRILKYENKIIEKRNLSLKKEKEQNKIKQNLDIKDIIPFTKNSPLPQIVIGEELSKNLGLKKGDIATIISTKNITSPLGNIPRMRRVEISAIYSSGVSDYENTLGFMELSDSQLFFRMSDNISGYDIRLYNLDDATSTTKILFNEISAKYYGLYLNDWTENNRDFFEALQLEKKVYFIVLLLIVVMASFSIISSLSMAVIEKKKDIALLRTLGVKATTISWIFRLQGAVIGLIGVVTGSILGIALCYGLKFYGFPINEKIFQVKNLPIYIDYQNILLIALCGFIICCFASFYPAKKASLLEPIEILRQ